MKWYIFLVLFFFVSKPGCTKKSSCLGEPVAGCVCTMDYKPVCGCDGKTYSNACVANCAGVKEWKDGECP